MSNVQLVDFANASDRLHIGIAQPVTRGDAHAELRGRLGGIDNSAQLASAIFGATRLTVAAGVQLHAVGAALVACPHLIEVGIDEKRNSDFRVLKSSGRLANGLKLSAHVQSALGGQLLAPFWN